MEFLFTNSVSLFFLILICIVCIVLTYIAKGGIYYASYKSFLIENDALKSDNSRYLSEITGLKAMQYDEKNLLTQQAATIKKLSSALKKTKKELKTLQNNHHYMLEKYHEGERRIVRLDSECAQLENQLQKQTKHSESEAKKYLALQSDRDHWKQVAEENARRAVAKSA